MENVKDTEKKTTPCLVPYDENDVALSFSLLKEAERILKELKSRVSEPDDYLNNQ